MDKRYIFREFHIPEHMHEALARYIDEGLPPGDFLTAIICNDLEQAVAHADPKNMRNIPAFVLYFCSLPSACWGSKERMVTWMKLKGGEK